jgi:putative pyruvate formate lyase activating enzyme
MGENPVVARAAPHFDEEPAISGTRGSGTVFFSGCALKCLFCQNAEISHGRFGQEITVERLTEIYHELADQGVHNINLVNPSHWANEILRSLEGFQRLPVVWNSGGYDRAETIARMEGKISIYLPDLKYIDPDLSRRYSGAADYFRFAGPALREMLRQTGPARLDADGIMASGTVVRHLILPGRADESKRVLDWIAGNLPGAWVSLMAQYMPMGRVAGIDELERRVMRDEYEEVLEHMFEIGLEDGYAQEMESSDRKYVPPFDLTGIK